MSCGRGDAATGTGKVQNITAAGPHEFGGLGHRAGFPVQSAFIDQRLHAGAGDIAHSASDKAIDALTSMLRGGGDVDRTEYRWFAVGWHGDVE